MEVGYPSSLRCLPQTRHISSNMVKDGVLGRAGRCGRWRVAVGKWRRREMGDPVYISRAGRSRHLDKFNSSNACHIPKLTQCMSTHVTGASPPDLYSAPWSCRKRPGGPDPSQILTCTRSESSDQCLQTCGMMPSTRLVLRHPFWPLATHHLRLAGMRSLRNLNARTLGRRDPSAASQDEAICRHG